ncbi:MAG TPA: FAD-binding oxidoreductase [Gemmatimonadaceae bacterium]|nr:FAD-binding oxidoreductase [Gemmatimonadaceae bacterium]
MSVEIRTLSGRDIVLPDDALDQLQDNFHGRLLTRGAAGYDEARTIWNAMVDRRPALIASCVDATDVAQAVFFARENSLLTSIRGGGHNIAGNAVSDDGFMIDLSPMRSVVVDPATRTARVGPGATLADVDGATQAYGLATPLGINSTTGIAGLTLGGGFGWLSRRLGLTSDNLRSADVVMADGTRVRASADENEDLFWGLKGGGGNFGVVTSFEFALHPVGPNVLAGLIVHPLDAAKDVLRFYRSFAPEAPEELALWFVMRKAPPLPFLPAEWHGREILVLAACYSGDIADGERILKPLRQFGQPIADVIGPQPFAAWQTILDPLLTPGMRNYWKSHDFLDLDDGLIDVLVDFARRLPDPNTEIAFAQLGGAISRLTNADSAYARREAQYLVNLHGRWADRSGDAGGIAWARDLFNAAAPFSTGSVYVNFLSSDDDSRVRAAYGANYDRLVALKNKYDPTNLFRVNQNIRPTAYSLSTSVEEETRVTG